MRKYGFREADRGKEIALEKTRPVFGRREGACCTGASADIRDEMVDFSEVLDGAVEGTLDDSGLGEVAGDGEDFFRRGELNLRGEEGGFITAGEDDARALSEEGLRNAAADASRAAGDEDDL